MIGDVNIVRTHAAGRPAGVQVESGSGRFLQSLVAGPIHTFHDYMRSFTIAAGRRGPTTRNRSQYGGRRPRIDWDAIAAVVADVERMD